MTMIKDINEFVARERGKLEDQKRQLEERAKQRLVEVLGGDIRLVKAIALDADVGKFFDIDAPPEIIDRLRSAGLICE